MEDKVSVSMFTILIQHGAGLSRQCKKQEEGFKGILIRKLKGPYLETTRLSMEKNPKDFAHVHTHNRTFQQDAL